MPLRSVGQRESFQARLKRLRERAELTQRQLAERCGWKGDSGEGSQSRVANYEAHPSKAGAREPTLSNIALMAAQLGVQPPELAYGEAAMTTSNPDPLEAVAMRYRISVEQVVTALTAVAATANSTKIKRGRR